MYKANTERTIRNIDKFTTAMGYITIHLAETDQVDKNQ